MLVVVDNHSSRFDAAMREEAAEAGIILLALPANSTHITQPLDAIPFGIFKEKSHKVVDQAQLHGVMITNVNRIALLAPAWRDAMQPKTIISAFQKTGIFPPRGEKGHQEPELKPLPVPATTPAQVVLQLPDPESAYTPDGWLKLRNLLHIPAGHDHLWVFPKHAQQRETKDGGFARILAAPVEMDLVNDPGARREEREMAKEVIQRAQHDSKLPPQPTRKRKQSSSSSHEMDSEPEVAAAEEEPSAKRQQRINTSRLDPAQFQDDPWMEKRKQVLRLTKGAYTPLLGFSSATVA